KCNASDGDRNRDRDYVVSSGQSCLFDDSAAECHSARARRPRWNLYPGGDLPALWTVLDGDRNVDLHAGNHQCAGADRAARLLCHGAPTSVLSLCREAELAESSSRSALVARIVGDFIGPATHLRSQHIYMGKPL